MENFDRENIDELLEIRQICQYFPRQKFAGKYGVIIFSPICSVCTWTCVLHVLQLFEQITAAGALYHTPL